jgi:NitT/TauT family transport system permease protein
VLTSGLFVLSKETHMVNPQSLLAGRARPQIDQRTRESNPMFAPGLGLAVSLVLLTLFWKLLVIVQDYPSFVLPAPDLVLNRLLDELFNGGTLPYHAALTFVEAISGFTLALTVSLLLGYLLAHAPRLERILAPQLAATQAVPVVAIAPLIILWVGADIRSKILVAALVTFFPILSSTIVALRSVPRELMEMARISGATRWQTLRFVEVPLALPGVFAGVKSGLALATTGAVVGEFVGGRDGLGALINISRGLFDTPLMFAALITLAAMTLTFYLLATLLERALVRWEW